MGELVGIRLGANRYECEACGEVLGDAAVPSDPREAFRRGLLVGGRFVAHRCGGGP